MTENGGYATIKIPMEEQINTVDIEEPLLSPKRSYIKKGYGASFGCLTIVLLLSAVLLRTYWGRAKNTITELPPHISQVLPLYPNKGIQKITTHTSSNVNHVYEAFAALPKAIINGTNAALTAYKANGDWENIKQAFTTTAKPYFERPGGVLAENEYVVMWDTVPESISDIKSYYLQLCKKNQNYACVATRDSQNDLVFKMEYTKPHFIATVTVENFNLARQGVESMHLEIVETPKQ